jgi:transposase-like protein
MLHIHHLIDDSKCYEEVRRLRWPYSIWCLHCESNKIAKRGKNHRHQECRRYRCRKCGKQFDDLTGTIFAGHHQPLRVWIISL